MLEVHPISDLQPLFPTFGDCKASMSTSKIPLKSLFGPFPRKDGCAADIAIGIGTVKGSPSLLLLFYVLTRTIDILFFVRGFNLARGKGDPSS
uniref:Uncharacterized protein n=1 Tax=Panagrellus redivivus TaxID=6233 RepID=A0A7E4V4T3_PANRE